MTDMSAIDWSAIHAERRALADDLEGISDEQWTTPSLCTGWSVHDVLAHVVATARMSPPRFIAAFAGSGFRFHRMAEKGIATEKSGGPARTLTSFRSLETATTAPPGPKESWLGEAIVHAEDIRRPLGIKRAYPLDAVTRTGTFFAGSQPIIGGKSRVAGVTLKATDTDWSVGSGPLVEGPALALLMATAGRKVFLDELTGPGVDVLRGR